MTASILTSIKKMLGIDASCTDFDEDILMHINTVIMILRQMAVGPQEGYSISSATETWADYLGQNSALLPAVKSYIYLKVKMLFDPPQSNAVIESITQMIAELEWRLNADTDPAFAGIASKGG